MKYLLQGAVLMLMVAVGTSPSPRQLLENWRRLTPSLWVKRPLATFLVPPFLALALGKVLPLDGGRQRGSSSSGWRRDRR